MGFLGGVSLGFSRFFKGFLRVLDSFLRVFSGGSFGFSKVFYISFIEFSNSKVFGWIFV